ncbi:MAG TPA: S9 family peptidase [Gemmatimonadaceae bacterium]|nr:S9 family peptidase [Gemmatimonadaceae bacterium]
MLRFCAVRPLVALTLAAVAGSAGAQQKQRYASLNEALASSAILAGRGAPPNVEWLDGGRRFSFISADPRTGAAEIRAYDPATGRDTLLFTGQGLVVPGTTNPFLYEGFQWARDFKNIVFQTNFKPIYRRSGTSDFYIYSLATRSLQLAGRGARTAELSPDGAMLGEERNGDLYLVDLSTHHERRLTSDATAHVFNGHFDWVYEEEFGLPQAWNWSPDSRHIAFWRVDERKEPEIQLTDYSGRHPTWDRIRIPQPGDSNPTVRIGAIDVHSGRTVWLDPHQRGEYYVPRLYWTSRPDTLAMLVLNRKQNDLKLFFFDVRTGGSRQVFEETSKTWIDVYDFYAGVQDLMSFPAGSHEFLWLSDRDGHQHIYRYDYSGKLIQQVTRGDWNVTRIEGTDAASQTIYFTSTNPSPLERQLWRVKFDGSGLTRVTTTAGRHQIDMSPDAKYFIDNWSSTAQPAQIELWSTASGKLRTMEDNAQTAAWLAAHQYSPTELFTFTTADGAKIDASMVKPFDFDPAKKYPVVFAIYGGPGSQGVYDQFNASGWVQWLAQNGYIVVNVNNRGTNNYGRDFMKVVYKQLGTYEARDFAAAAAYLRNQSYVDGSRIAIMGTSYGGYSTMYSMEMYPDVFSVGIANSGVADWRLYDSIYTERYMSTLDDNQAGYMKSSVVENAARLGGHLLMIHSMMDDNVHPQNTMQLFTAFTNAGKDIEERIYPPGRHGAAYNAESNELINHVTFDFLSRWTARPETSAPVRP